MKQNLRINVPEDSRGWGENKRVLPAMDVVVQVEIDVEEIARHFGRKAARSRSGRSRMLNGLVNVKVLK